MGESYPERAGDGSPHSRSSSSAASPEQDGAAVVPPVALLARDLIAQLIPDTDADRLTIALLAERETGGVVPDAQGRQLASVRAMIARGSGMRELQHAFNNPLTALLAEAQLLLLEELPPEGRASAERMVGLVRRLALLARQMNRDVSGPPTG